MIGAIDQGTTSSRFMVFDQDGSVVAKAQQEFKQIYPRPGRVEHDPMEILASVENVIRQALSSVGLVPQDLVAVGITNQRETAVVWDRSTGLALANAIVWQDTRTAPLCEEIGGEEGMDRFRPLTGLPLASYFSGPKVTWLLDQVEGLSDSASAGRAIMGTVDSWLLWHLTGGVRGGRHVTDVSNASRTLLMDLSTLKWSDPLLEAMRIPPSMTAEIVPSIGRIGVG
ncbi:MAG: glycerol kinase, partial [Acidimicrobiia bacterium]|nr:glycerol kinase [Acidimicrobiia bacterium]